MAKIRILPGDSSVSAHDGESVLDASLREGISFAHVCGGMARCSTCRVVVVEGAESCTPRTSSEREIAARLHFPDSIRLACQLRISADVVVRRLVLEPDDIDLASQVSPSGVGSTVGEETSQAILFTDLRNFTNLAEALPPYDLMHVLERHFVAMSRVARARGGIVNNTMGDGMLFLFEAETPAHACAQAVRAGLEMLEAQARLSAHVRDLFGRGLEMGIGVHFGDLVAGSLNCGEEHRRIVIGDAINLASRVEQANKTLGTHLLVSDVVASMLAGRLRLGLEAEIPIKGKSGLLRLHEVLGLDSAFVAG